MWHNASRKEEEVCMPSLFVFLVPLLDYVHWRFFFLMESTGKNDVLAQR